MDMHCVENLLAFHSLAADHHLSKFSDFWAPDYKNAMPLKAAFTPEHLVSGKNTLLANFYDPGLTTSKGEADPLNPPHYRVSRELMGRIVHTFKRQYISDDDDKKMSAEFEDYLKGVMGSLETVIAESAKQVADHHAISIKRHEGLMKDAHDYLKEAFVKFKDAVERQVDVIVMHNDRHESLKEDFAILSMNVRAKIKDVNFPPPISRQQVRKASFEADRKLVLKYMEISRKNWEKRSISLEKEIEQLKLDKQGLIDQSTSVGLQGRERLDELRDVRKTAQGTRMQRKMRIFSSNLKPWFRKISSENLERITRGIEGHPSAKRCSSK
jgi:hypothetical protein